MAGYTPMMAQYLNIKKEHKDCLLFFRLGDFYELFFEDAKVASKALGLTLTSKACGMPEKAPMCGIPFHSCDSYIAKLVKAGYKVAICEQVEDPRLAKKIVKREVIRIITSGTVTDDKMLDSGKNNYIMSIYLGVKGTGLAFCDISTGEFLATEAPAAAYSKIIDETAKFSPSEIIINIKNDITDKIYNVFGIKAEVFHEWAFERGTADICLCNHFGVLNLSGFGIESGSAAVCAAGGLLEYVSETQKNDLSNIRSLKKYNESSYMILDISSRRNLELTETLREKNKKGSLLWVMDKTRTSGGARLLRKWIEQPLINVDEIKKRQDAVEAFKDNVIDREELREYLGAVQDIERIMGKVAYLTANAKDLNALRASFENLPYIKSLLGAFNCGYINVLEKEFDSLGDIYDLIDRAINPEAPFSLREGGLIKKGFNEEIDKLNEAKTNGTKWIEKIEAEEKQATGIKNLRIRYNRVFGYYIEVTNSYKSLVPDRYIRKQTLANAERYITPELKEVEDQILGADEKVTGLEYDVFCEVRNRVDEQMNRIMKTAEVLAAIDVLSALGEIAEKNNYCRPVVNEGDIIKIEGGRHPVVELLSREPFIPNDTYLDDGDNRLIIVTGPNMAGKSTFMRQTALLVLMAQTGSFIPAVSAEIGVCDRIFTRVGASDDLATGQSTFMIEMAEVANILNNATKKSLLILDEIGRGTSTYDGLSIARAVLEYIADKKILGARTLFATHYHELTELEGKVEGVKNYCVAVEEQGDDIIFLRKIVKGGTDKSYGIHVAKLAGVPFCVIERANEILAELIGRFAITANDDSDDKFYPSEEISPMYLKFCEDKTSILEEIKLMDLDNITPMEALGRLMDIKKRLKGDKDE